MASNYVKVALDEHRVALLHHPITGFVESIEHAALSIERCVRGVDVLRRSVAQNSATEANEIAPVIADWEHESTEEFIGVSILLVALNKEQALSLNQLVAIPFELANKSLANGGGITQFPFVDDRLRNVSIIAVGLCRRGFSKLVPIKDQRRLHGRKPPFSLGFILSWTGVRRELDTSLIG